MSTPHDDFRPPLRLAQVDDQPTTTVHLVELAELTNLARLGMAMRRAQMAYFEARQARPHVNAKDELIAARTAEAKFDRACAAALRRERACLPGMEGGGS